MNTAIITSIEESFRFLVNEKSYDQITISDISTKSNISRKSFYNYHSDKDSVVIGTIRKDFVEPIRAVRAVLCLNRIKSSTQLMLEKFYETFLENRKYYIKVIEGIGEYRFLEILGNEMEDICLEAYANHNISQIDKEYAASMLSQMQGLSLLWWIRRHPELESKEVATLFNRWFFAYFREFDPHGFYEKKRAFE